MRVPGFEIIKGAQSAQFQETIVPWKFLLGEYCLHVAQIRAWQVNGSFLDPAASDFNTGKCLRDMLPSAQVLLLPASPAGGLRPGLRLSRYWIRYIPALAPRYHILVRGSFEDYLKTNFSAKTRHNLTRSIKQFSRFCGGQVDFRAYRTPEQMEEFHALACQVSRRTYQHRLLQVGLPETRQFVERLVDLAAQDRVRDYLLFYQGRPVAYAHCTCKEALLTYETIGYDPEFARWSPGTVLLLLILEQVFGEGRCRVLDFGPGEAHYKSMFSTNQVISADVYFFRWSLRNLVTVCCHSGLDGFSSGVGRLLAKMGLKERMRKVLRKSGEKH